MTGLFSEQCETIVRSSAYRMGVNSVGRVDTDIGKCESHKDDTRREISAFLCLCLKCMTKPKNFLGLGLNSRRYFI